MKKSALILGVFISFLIITFTSCKKDEKNELIISKGTVSGKVFAANGSTVVPEARIFIVYDNETYSTKSNSSGNFSLEAPVGNHVLYIKSGNGKIFQTQLNVSIQKDIPTILKEESTVLEQVANLAYIQGAYDDIQSIVTSLGYTATEIQISDLDNLSTMQAYNAILLNCGKYDMLDNVKYNNLLQYVMLGGSIYASDWAVEYLTGDGFTKGSNSHKITENPKSTCVGDVGGFIDDATLCTEKIGPSTNVNAEIVAPSLAAYLGVITIPIEYDLGGWEVVQDNTAPWQTLLNDPITYGPLAMMMDFGSVYENNGGVVIFTTFHNHPQFSKTSEIQKILEFFIFSL